MKGSVRKDILRELHMGAPVEVIATIGKNRGMTPARIGVKIRDKNSKQMTVHLGGFERDICYFNLTCRKIEEVLAVQKTLAGIQELAKNDDLPF
jgi:hypothetical protein